MEQPAIPTRRVLHANTTKLSPSHRVLSWTIKLSPGFMPVFPLNHLHCSLNDTSGHRISGVCIKTLGRGWRDGSVGKDTCRQAWWPEFCYQHRFVEGKKWLPLSFDLYSDTVPHTYPKSSEKIKAQQKIFSFLFSHPPEELPSFVPVLLGSFNPGPLAPISPHKLTPLCVHSLLSPSSQSACVFPADGHY